MADEAKAKGNAAFSSGDFTAAIRHFSDAIALAPENHVLYSNRSASYASLKKYTEALSDANKTVKLKPDWSKGYSRLGAAHIGLSQFDDAVSAYSKGLEIDPNNEPLKSGLADAQAAAASRSSRSANPFGYAFSDPEMWAKLIANATTRGYLQQPDFMKIMQDIHKDPNNLELYLKDPRVLKAFGVLFNAKISIAEDSDLLDSPPASSSERKRAAEAEPVSQPEPEPEAMEVADEESEAKQRKAEAQREKEAGNAAYKKKQFDTAIQHMGKLASGFTELLEASEKSAEFDEENGNVNGSDSYAKSMSSNSTEEAFNDDTFEGLQLTSGDFMYLGSTNQARNILLKALQDDRYHSIGLFGKRGSGKTTLVKAEIPEYENIFHLVVYVTVSEQADIAKLQNQIAHQLNLKLKAVKSKHRRASAIESALLKSVGKVLVIFDDVSTNFGPQDIEDIGIPDPSKQLKILLITHDKKYCNMIRCNPWIPLYPLSDEDAWKLLQQYSSIDNDSPSDLINVAREVAFLCMGLPRVIEDVVSSLHKKDTKHWKETLDCLNHSTTSHQIFISFRGKDTRDDFTASLFDALVQGGFKVFKDDEELPSGDQISEALIKAIEQSRCSIVVLSENYAESSWCLDELVRILKCRKQMKQLVLPIFYKVDPSNVRYLKGSFGEAMKKKKERFKEDRIQEWTSALFEVSDLSGRGYKTGSQIVFIKGIVQYVRENAHRLHIVSKYEDCIKDCDKAVERGRELRADYKMVARALTRKGTALVKMAKCSTDFDPAIETFQKALTEHRNPDTLKKLNEAQKAKKDLEQQEYFDPKLADEEREKGNEFFKQQKYPEAVGHYTESLRRNPNDPRAYSNRAACYTKLGAMPEGLKDAEKCIELDPTFVKGYTRKGAVQYFMKDYEKALETYRDGLKLDPNNQELLDGIGKCMQQINKASRGDLTPEELKERQAKGMQDPEIQNILQDPVMRQVLVDFQENPKAAQDHAKNPMVMSKIQKLISAGIVQMK